LGVEVHAIQESEAQNTLGGKGFVSSTLKHTYASNLILNQSSTIGLSKDIQLKMDLQK